VNTIETLESMVGVAAGSMLKMLVMQFGVLCNLYREETISDQREAYGIYADKATVPRGTVRVIIPYSGFVVTDNLSTGALETTGYVYVGADGELKVDDVLEPVRPGDSRIRRYKVLYSEFMGVTKPVCYRYKVSALGD